MKCVKCGFDNPEGMQFCGKCGTKLEITCSTCGFNNPSDFQFCGKCGQDLIPTTESDSVDYSKPDTYTP